MSRLRLLFPVTALLASTACAHAHTHASSPAASSAGARKAGANPAEFIEQAQRAMAQGVFAEAGQLLDRAERAAGDAVDALDEVYYYRATLAAFTGDYDEAARLLWVRLGPAEARLGDPRAFWIHNALMMVRGAQGDLAGALLENAAATRFGRRATFEPEGMSREKLVSMKDLWHRAYYLRMLAERRDGHAREALLRYAEEARSGYRAIAAPMPKYQDSIAVLDGLFAALAGDADAALAAGRRVNVAENGDLEDLVLTFVALKAGGAEDEAAAVANTIAQSDAVYLARPIVAEWLRRMNEAPARFSPLRPTGEP